MNNIQHSSVNEQFHEYDYYVIPLSIISIIHELIIAGQYHAQKWLDERKINKLFTLVNCLPKTCDNMTREKNHCLKLKQLSISTETFLKK